MNSLAFLFRIFVTGGADVRVSRPNGASEDRPAATSNLLRTIVSALEITDLIVLIMVLVTGLRWTHLSRQRSADLKLHILPVLNTSFVPVAPD